MEETHGNKVDWYPVTFISSQSDQRCTTPDLGRAFAQFQQARNGDRMGCRMLAATQIEYI